MKIEENWLIESLPVWDWSNGYNSKKSNDSITMTEYTTYRKAKKGLSEEKDTIEKEERTEKV